MAKTILELLYGSSQNNEQKTQEPTKNTDEANFFIKGLHTIGDIAANVLTGAAKGLEGIYDFGAGIVGAVGGIFNKDFQDDVQKHIAYDWTSENIGNPLQELTKYSYTNDWGTVGELIEGAASGVGQMIPAVGASLIPGVGAVAANAALFASATGNATESAYNDGASYYGGLGYGLASGAVELATERLMGGATKNVFGRGMIDGVGKSIADTGLKRVAKNALSEGFEEALAEVANPALKAIYKGKNAFSEYTSPEFIGNVGKAAAIGSLTALGYSGTVGYGMSRIKTKNGKRLNYVGAEADVNDSLQEIEGQKAKRNNLFTYDKLSVENEAKIVENVKGNYQNIERTLQKAKPEKRAKLIKEFRLESAFEADGTMNADFASTLDYTKQAEALTENGENSAENATTIFDRRYINPDLIGQEKKVRETFASVTEDLRQKYMQKNNATYEQAVEAVKDITPFKKDFTDKGKASYSKFKKGLNYLNRMSGHTVNMVVVDEHDIFNGHILGDTIYIGADTFENDTWAGTLVHEYTHFAESSEEYTKLVRYLREDASLFEKAFESVANKGYASPQEMEKIFDKVQSKESLTEEESEMLSLFESELGAHLTENLLGNEAFIDRLVGKETSLAEKVLNKITDLKKMFERIGNAEARAEYKQIKKAEKLYLGAVEKAGYAYINRKIVAAIKREELDKNGEIQYNSDKIQHSRKVDRKPPTEHEFTQYDHGTLRARVMKKNSEGIGLYPVDFDRTVNHFVVYYNNGSDSYKIIKTFDLEIYDDILTELEENIKNGKIYRNSKDLRADISRFRTEKRRSGNSDDSIAERKSNGENGGFYRSESESEGKQSDRKSSGNQPNISFSLKDSNGNSLTKEQVKFFADSKVRDDNGNLLVVYHGTEGEFFTFDKALRGSVTGTRDAKLGFFFTSNKEVALEYAIEALDTKFLNLRHKIANGDREVLSLLAYVDGYKELAATEDVKEYGRLQDRIENYENDIMELYLNITNPLIEDWKGQPYKKARMLKLVTRALQGDYDGVIVKNIDDAIDQTGENISDVFVAFEPNQIKSTLNKKPTVNDDIRYSLKADINDYTEKQYNDFGWARVNGVLSYRENGNFRAKYGEIKSGKQSDVHRTASGEIIVATNDMEKGKFGINNVLVFAKGSYENYKITRVIRLKSNSETHLDIVRGFIYEYENDTNAQTRYTLEELYGEEVIEQYDSRDCDDYRTSKARARARGRGTQSVGSEQDSGIGAIGRRNLDQNRENELGKFSLKESAEKDKYFYRLSDGQEKKALANYTKFKVYSKVDAETIVNNVLGNYMSFDETYGVISGKTKNEVIEMLWRGLNTAEKGKQAKVSLDIAEYIIQNAVLENIYEGDSNQEYMNTIQVLKPYLHSINLDSIKGDIDQRYGKDKRPYRLWGKRKGVKARGADVIAMELAEQGFSIEATNPADIFFEIHDTYRACVAALKKQAKELLDSSLTNDERKELKQKIAKEVLRGFDYQGKPSKLANIAKKYSDKAKFWKDKYYDERDRETVIKRLLHGVQEIKEDKLGAFLNASQFNKNEIFKGSILKLSNIKYRGDLNKSGTRKIVAGIQEWYAKKNPMLENCFDEEISSMLEEIATGEGDLTTSELRALANVVDYFTHFIKNYNKVYRNEEYVDAQPIAKKYVDNMHANQNANVGWLRRFFEKYITTFGDPMTVARYMDRYSDGFYSEQLEALRMGVIGAGVMEMEMREPLEEFYKKHKKFLKTLKDKTITYQGTEIPLSQAMLLYMSLNREQAILGLAKSGFAYADKNGKIIRPNGFAVEEGLEIDEIRLKAKDVQKELVSQFTETELEYISIAERLFNEDCKEAKRKTDMNLRGYTNALDDYYVPIRRYVVGKSVDAETYLDEMASVSNASFNKDTVKGAKNELFLGTLENVLDRHIRAVSLYANLVLPLRDYDVLYNLDTAGNPNKPTSVKTEGVNVWAKGDEYFKKLVKDIKGIPASNSIIDKLLSWLRGGYAKYQLGANPKVWFTQLSSFGAAGSMLDVSSIIKGFGVKAKDVDEYCALAKLRNNENSAALAQGVMEKTGKIGDILMNPIGMVDRLVIKKLFGACQVQIEKNGGAKIGTKENKIEAGKLLERVILETQQNALATEKSWAMRDGSELLKTLTMFSADSMKVIGRVIDSIGEVAVLKAKRKNVTDPLEIASLDKKIKTATKQAGLSIASLVSTAVFMALIAQLFRTLYNKDDEDENVAENMAVDTAGNLLGGLPLFRDIYSFYAEGYDLDNYAYSTVNDLLKSGQDALNLIGNAFDGATDSKDVAASIKKAAYAGGQLLGIPTRNVYNFVYGLTKRFSASTAYKIDNMFYNQNYSSDLAKAIENEDDEMIATIAGIMLDEKVGDVTDSSVRGELDDLIKKGFKVLPKSVGESITYEGEKIDLTSRQAKSFKEVYSVANEALASLVGLSQYESATDEVKAKAINFIWDIYYNLAIEEVLGVDIESKVVLFAEAIDIEKLAIIIATAREIEADTDKNGKSISGTRKAKIQKYVASLKLTAVQKYMIMGYLGYSNTNGQSQVKACINRLNLSKTEKEKLLEYSGY